MRVIRPMCRTPNSSTRVKRSCSTSENSQKSERHILRRVAEGKTSRQISEELFISFKTVENHRSNISEKLGISGTLSLITYAFSIKPFLDSIE